MFISTKMSYGRNHLYMQGLSRWLEVRLVFFENFPGGPVVKNLPVNSRNMGSVPNPGTININKIPQLSLCATTTEACVC